jgi:hypothetical protein
MNLIIKTISLEKIIDKLFDGLLTLWLLDDL